MIDYDKLKIAHEICQESGYSFSYFFGGQAVEDNWTIYDLDSGPILDDGEDINDLITKLRELTQPEPKYKDCWYVGVGGHQKCTKVLNQNGYVVCDETDLEAIGLHVIAYATKAQLIEAQIEYWQSLREPQDEYCNVSGAKLGKREPTEGTTGCQHESDGEDYRYQCAHHYKCTKCGEFYR